MYSSIAHRPEALEGEVRTVYTWGKTKPEIESDILARYGGSQLEWDFSHVENGPRFENITILAGPHKPPMSAQDLYQIEPERTTHDVSRFLQWGAIPEIFSDCLPNRGDFEDEALTLKYLDTVVSECCENASTLATLWFHDKPVMVVHLLDDYDSNTFITDPEQYKLLVDYLVSLYRPFPRKHQQISDNIPMRFLTRAGYLDFFQK